MQRFLGVVGRALVLAAWLLAASSARADESEYQSLVRDGLQELEAQRYEEAAALFNRAHELSPSARTHRGLGLTYFAASKYSLAITHLRAALVDTRRPLTAAQRADVAATLEKAESFVTRVQLSVDPGTAVVTVDGHPVELREGTLTLDPGRHEIIVQAQGHDDDRRTVDAVSGTTLQLSVVLREAAALAPQAAPEPVHEGQAPAAATVAAGDAQVRSSGPGLGPILTLSLGGALLIGAATTGLLASDLHSEIEDRCKLGCDDTKTRDDKDRGATLVVATNVLLAGGLTAATAGALWWLLGADDATEARVAAYCDPTGCGATLRTRM